MLLVDKPAGPTSRATVDAIVRRFGRRDIGHAGTLDPFATGLLLVLVGRATRLVPWTQEWPKRYRAMIRFGEGTDTLDYTGTVTSRGDVPEDLLARLPAAIAALTGEIRQAPPMVSAAKVGGRRLHELARAGEIVERKERERVVHAFDIIGFNSPDLEVDVTCSSGTYVRVLAESLGGALGVPAHLAGLRRTAIGPWPVEQALAPDAIEALTPPELVARTLIAPGGILVDWPTHEASGTDAIDIGHGRIPGVWTIDPPRFDRCRIVRDGSLLALVERNDGAFRFLRVFAPAEPGNGLP
ncbi:MAG TPA: tRNA pseudouridine(55) synthase TruB [Candidatus Eisenbacteria bacterium]